VEEELNKGPTEINNVCVRVRVCVERLTHTREPLVKKTRRLGPLGHGCSTARGNTYCGLMRDGQAGRGRLGVAAQADVHLQQSLDVLNPPHFFLSLLSPLSTVSAQDETKGG